MLVDNGVIGDSRVQKAARSAADAGWDVVLLGRAPAGGQPQSWRLGDAEVRLIPMPEPLAKRRHEFRRALLRAPLAYPPSGIGAHRAQAVKAWRADLQVRRAALTLAARDGGGVPSLAWPTLRFEEKFSTLVRLWVSLRNRELSRARRGRKLTSPWDRAYTLFWQRLRGGGAWRRLEPGLWDYELAYGPVVDELAPDLIHANDFRMIGVGARAKIRAAAQGRRIALLWDAHEYLPGVQPWRDNARWLPGNVAHEREFVPYADATMTVSGGLADLLQREHGLAERPAVVLNAPTLETQPAGSAEPVPDIRALCGIGPVTPLLVYSGVAAAKRGLGVMVEALPRLPEAHVAFVVNKPQSAYVKGLLRRAEELGVAGRVHLLPYVPHHQVVPFLSGAQVGVIPIQHWPNHEIALITKFFEYSHARLPLVVSDVRTMAETVRETGQGEVFEAEDVADFVRAVTAVLADPARYRAAYDRPGLLAGWTWEAQAEVLDDVYSRLLPAAPPRPMSARDTSTGAEQTVVEVGA
ncbi:MULTISPECIES: glycosyltransferase family 4 protein [unclassified Micromonospora]|uniref:glycosyltransferase family 4 protein n=1 Tax=unclassified Micromonospora TaxID=2617518 RepID=UPI001B38488C|nr:MULTISPECIES: glycosyltransferase family 4 protein [unclassified Micromonospora]MBQ0981025.1 glycosyltransferase family 4 protein [Micromonospora sp. M61]MBQ1038598.1 glycosyltransferase family 4 protein [Micromonospora sp. C81]